MRYTDFLNEKYLYKIKTKLGKKWVNWLWSNQKSWEKMAIYNFESQKINAEKSWKNAENAEKNESSKKWTHT